MQVVINAFWDMQLDLVFNVSHAERILQRCSLEPSTADSLEGVEGDPLGPFAERHNIGSAIGTSAKGSCSVGLLARIHGLGMPHLPAFVNSGSKSR